MTRPERRSHGDGRWTAADFASLGRGTILEEDVLVFHAGHITIGEDVYVAHRAILKAYHLNELVIGDGAWIGEGAFIHAAGGVRIGRDVGIGPRVTIISSHHAEDGRDVPILHARIALAQVVVEDGSDIGVGAIILPGITVGRGALIGAGAVVSRDVPPYAVAAGVPARILRERPR